MYWRGRKWKTYNITTTKSSFVFLLILWSWKVHYVVFAPYSVSVWWFWSLFLSENKGLMFMETSALDSTNVEAAFNEVLTGDCRNVLSHPQFRWDLWFTYWFVPRVSSHSREGGQQTGDPRLHQCCDPVQHNRAQWGRGEEQNLLQELLMDQSHVKICSSNI